MKKHVFETGGIALVVKENRLYAKPLLEALQEKGFETHFCRNASDALELSVSAKGRLALIVMGTKIPSGHSLKKAGPYLGMGVPRILYEEIRKRQRTVPIFVLTGMCREIEEFSRIRDASLSVVDTFERVMETSQGLLEQAMIKLKKQESR